MKKIMIVLLLVAPWPALAQTSASFKLEEHVFNAGGHPLDGTVFTSASFKVSLDAIGDAAPGGGFSGASFHMDGGFVGWYPPPGEVPGLRFTGRDTLAWNPERSVGVYNLYRDLMSNLSGLGYGNCRQKELESETATETDVPPPEDGYFYLVTAVNRLSEEGTKGFDGSGIERPNPAPCP
jgi:hypothetical protein